MKIEVLGMGCRKCVKLYDRANKAVAEAGVEAEVVKVENMEQIIGYGVMKTPALVVDGKVVVSGRVPELAEIVTYLK